MLEVEKICKEFPGVKALDQVSIQFFPGKVNALLGENGAGKSTLLKILSGVYTSYSGCIKINGHEVSFKNTRESQSAGIAIIHQELNLFPDLTISENIFLGRELKNSWGILEEEKMNRIAAELLQKVQVNASPTKKIKELKIGEQQLVEIAKALHAEASIILMDEPTSALSDAEISNLHQLIHSWKLENKTIVYISHKMEALFQIADHYCVLRDGLSVAAGNMSDTDQSFLIQSMVGRDIVIEKKSNSNAGTEKIFSIRNLELLSENAQHRKKLNQISFDLHRAEIVGIFGLMGAGRTEILECIFGLHPSSSKFEMEVAGKKCFVESPRDAIALGMAFITEDRKMDGLVMNQDLDFNISLTHLKNLQLIDDSEGKKMAKDFIQQLKIKTPSEKAICGNLSGGNQQKVILAKWLSINPVILLMDEPTRGIDIQAKSEIYQLIKTVSLQGMSIIIVSSEIPEIMALADRVLVISEGEIQAELIGSAINETELLKAALPKKV